LEIRQKPKFLQAQRSKGGAKGAENVSGASTDVASLDSGMLATGATHTSSRPSNTTSTGVGMEGPGGAGAGQAHEVLFPSCDQPVLYYELLRCCCGGFMLPPES